MSTSSRIIRNTGYLYIKMGVTMILSLYSTRLILASLGASDFGIFSVVGGAIAMLGFLNSTLSNATQRFMSYAEGEGILDKKRKIFNVSVVLHIIIAVITALLLLAVMTPLFNSVFNIQTSRIPAAKIIYICLILNTILTITNVPYEAVMNAHENMLYYSIIGIIASLLNLGIAFMCVYTGRDKLILYGILSVCLSFITLSIMKVYCHRHYGECIIAPRQYWDGSIVKQISKFFGWNFLTAISSLFTAQGIGVVLNHFYGTVLNAAQGVANQVFGVVSNFSGNMMKALNPVIVKSAGAQDTSTMNRFTIAGCKYSALLIMIFGIPLSIEIQYVLSIWLKDVPSWTSVFVVMQFAIGIITQMASSAATAVYAQGRIKEYAIWKSIMNALPLFVTWFAFQIGAGPIWLYIPMLLIWGIGGDIVIVHYASAECGLNVRDFVFEVVLPLLGTTFFMVILGLVPTVFMETSFVRLALTCFSTSIGLCISAYMFAITKEEKERFKVFAKGILNIEKNNNDDENTLDN